MATPLTANPEQVDVLKDENWNLQLYLSYFIALSIILTFLAAVMLWNRKKMIQGMNIEIERKSQELIEIENQVRHANEELRAINSNLEGIVEERTLKLSKVNRELDMFLYRASHDLRRPIATIMGLVEVSKLGFDEVAAKMLFDRIHDTAVNMDNMLEKFSMINAINHESFDCCEVDFSEIVEKIRQSSIIHTYASQIQFDIHIDPNIRLISEPNLLAFILKNLIDNSVIFRCRSNERQSVIRLTIRQLGNTVGIELYDNGIGISQSMLPEIFHIFYRGSEASKGNGLGLYVVQKAIEKLHGEIRIDSKANEWTYVYMILPQTEAPTIALNSETLKSASAMA